MMSLQAWSERVDCMHRLKARRIAAVCTETRFMGRSAEWKQELKDTCCDLTGKNTQQCVRHTVYMMHYV